MNKRIQIDGKPVSENSPTYVVAEVSANHLGDCDRAIEIIKAAKWAGADAVKVQTYTPDTITIDAEGEFFVVNHGSLWDGQNLHSLYKKAYMPWDWQPLLKAEAEALGLSFFSSAFDFTAVEFLEDMGVPAHKVASLEIVDIPLIKCMAKTKKPIMISTGIAREEDITEALNACQSEDNNDVILLKCTSTYPAPYDDCNLLTIPDMAKRFDCIVGLSDHTMGDLAVIAGVALGAKVIEKHITLSREDGGPDGPFSMEPGEFKDMVDKIRGVEKVMGKATYDLTYQQQKTRENARSLFVVESILKGDILTPDNVRSIRPGQGLHPRFYEEVIGRMIKQDVQKGTPLSWELIE
jgi:pseudaminic acid synthase